MAVASSRDDLYGYVQERLRERSRELSERWLAEVRERLPEDPERIFPTRTLLDHVPELLGHVAQGIADGRRLSAMDAALDALRDLAELRRLQGYEASEIVAEFELLGEIVFAAVVDATRSFSGEVAIATALEAAHRTSQAFFDLARATTEQFARTQSGARLDRARLIHQYSRTLGHELRGLLNAARLQVLLSRDALGQRDVAAADAGLEATLRVLRKLERTASGSDAVAVSQRREVALEARRQGLRRTLAELEEDLRDYVRHYDVSLRLPSDAPDFAVDAGRLQLVLVHLVASAVEGVHPERRERWIEIRIVPAGERVWRIEVSDNGVGLGPEAQERLFDPGYGASLDAGAADGEGLGLAVAREATAQMGGRLWLEQSGPEGSTYVVEIREPPEAVERTT